MYNSITDSILDSRYLFHKYNTSRILRSELVNKSISVDL